MFLINQRELQQRMQTHNATQIAKPGKFEQIGIHAKNQEVKYV